MELKFNEPSWFKDTLKLYAVQNSDYTYMHKKKRDLPFARKNVVERVHASWTNDKEYFHIKTLFDVHNCGSHYHNKIATMK